MRNYHRQPKAATGRIPLDDLPSRRVEDAMMLRRFLLQHGSLTFVSGAPSTSVVQDLERAGLIRLRRSTHAGVDLLEVA